MRLLKQSTARNFMILMIDNSDHLTGKASLTLTITASKDGAAFASISPTVTDRGSGWYNLALTTSHTDTLGDLALHITGTGADPSDVVAHVVVKLPGEDVTIASGAITASTIAADAITAAKVASDVGAEIADAVWDELTSGHTTTGSTGKALTDAGSAGTPPTATAIADAVMTRASSNWEASAPAKSLGTAVMKMTHRVESASGSLNIYRSDGSTLHVAQTETTDAAADPLIGLGGAA